MEKYQINNGKKIVEKIKDEEWYENEMVKSNKEFLNWLFERKENAQ